MLLRLRAVDGAAWCRFFACWIVAASAALFLLALIAPVYGRFNAGKSWMLPAILIAIPSVYGGVMGFGMPGRAPWRVLLVGGALAAVPLLISGLSVYESIRNLAAVTAGPMPALAISDLIARRFGLSPNARLGAALSLAIGVAAIFGLAERCKWVPQVGIICVLPIPGEG